MTLPDAKGQITAAQTAQRENSPAHAGVAPFPAPNQQGQQDWLCQTAGATAPWGGNAPHKVGSAAALIPWPYPRWIAHRGAGKLAPENTLAAFAAGASHGYRMFECDAKLSADGTVFLLHDTTLERTSNGLGEAGKQSWQQLAGLDAGSWHSAPFAGEPMPSLEAVALFCLNQGHFLNIEIKPTPGTEAVTGTGVANAAAKLWHNASTPPLLSSFQVVSLRAAKAAQPQLPRALLLDKLTPDWLATALALECVAVVFN